jgi:hypothetical protein
MKQTFVQLSAPILQGLDCFGGLRITTYWRHVDRKTGVLRDVIQESISQTSLPIPNFDLTPGIENATYDDLGAGQIRATVQGRFLSGTYVRVGSNYYREGSLGFTSELTKIRFVASAAEVAKYKAYLVARDGTETEILTPGNSGNIQPLLPAKCLQALGTTDRFDLNLTENRFSARRDMDVTVPIEIRGRDGFSSSVTLSVADLPQGMSLANANSQIVVNPGSNSSVTANMLIRTTSQTTLGPHDFHVTASSPGFTTKSAPVQIYTTTQPNVEPLSVSVSAYDDSRSIVTATLYNLPALPDPRDLLVIINDRLFGLIDAPIERSVPIGENKQPIANSARLRAIVSNSILNGANDVKVKALFWDARSYERIATLDTWNIENSSEKIVPLTETKDGMMYVLYGSRLCEDSVKFPENIKLKELPGGEPSTIRTFVLPKDKAGTKQLVLQKKANERYVFCEYSRYICA